MTEIASTRDPDAGWRPVGPPATIAPGRVARREIDGAHVVLFRSPDGAVRGLDAHCPHLGAHLGHGGCVEGDAIRCPFHGWKVAGDGRIEEIPYSPAAPPRARVGAWEVREQGGLVEVRRRDGAEEPRARLGSLAPFPTGWYALCFSDELGREPIDGVWLGERLRVERTPDGPRVTPAGGGAPRPVVEQQGAVLAWFDALGRAPTFTLPTPDPTGWSSYAGHLFPRLATHPQETSENSVDVAHFAVVHRYADVRTIEPATTRGPVLSARYAFTRQALPYLVTSAPIRVEFTVQVVGLGYSLVESVVERYGLRTRQMVYATPIDGAHVDLRIAGAVKQASRRVPGRALAAAVLRWGMMRGYVDDVSADLAIWQNKRYAERPIVVQGDGPIQAYRAWARQFYPAPPGG